MDDPKLVSSRTVFEGRVVNIEVHEIEVGNGVRTVREVLFHPGAVCMVPVTASGSLLLVTQYRLAAGRRLLELPAGTLEKGEEPAECAARELQEEVGQAADSIEAMGGFFVAPGYTSEYIHLFIATGLRASVLEGDEDEDIEVVEVSLERALEYVADGTVCDAKSVIGILRYARTKGM